MKKTGVVSGLATLFAVAAIGAVVADAGGYFNTQKFDLTVARKHNSMSHDDVRRLAVEDTQGRIFVIRGDLLEGSDTLFERFEEGSTYCAVKGEPVFMRKPSQPILIGIHANGPCP